MAYFIYRAYASPVRNIAELGVFVNLSRRCVRQVFGPIKGPNDCGFGSSAVLALRPTTLTYSEGRERFETYHSSECTYRLRGVRKAKQ